MITLTHLINHLEDVSISGRDLHEHHSCHHLLYYNSLDKCQYADNQFNWFVTMIDIAHLPVSQWSWSVCHDDWHLPPSSQQMEWDDWHLPTSSQPIELECLSLWLTPPTFQSPNRVGVSITMIDPSSSKPMDWECLLLWLTPSSQPMEWECLSLWLTHPNVQSPNGVGVSITIIDIDTSHLP